ncbi:MAG TPA: YafY family protein [Bryobacteraceae bacterium]|jgi:predicted DNA-binding transcriptional regulator YafY|nr:YafY family protein [Bryobacteraceae bacterium]
MRRADRLFQIVQHLRGRRLTTAAQLAGWLQVSERTVYRDIRDLTISGIPVEGEAGVGYRLKAGFDLPAIMFTMDEVEALVAGARVIETWGGPALGRHARSALAKIALALPAARREEIERTRLFAPAFLVPAGAAEGLDTIRQAILQRRKLYLEYVDKENRASARTIEPLAINFWGTTWSVAAWCESRADFRVFRLDRIRKLEMRPETFEEIPGRTLADFVESVNRERD